MPVTPYCKNLFQSRRDLHQFLLACQQESLEKDHPRIISISLEIEPVDPLIVFDQIAQTNQLNFYIEKRDLPQNTYSDAPNLDSKSVSGIAAIGSAIDLQVGGCNRFQAAKEFIHSVLSDTVIVGDSHLPLAGPHFFCGFTFFDNCFEPDFLFPAATVFLPKWQVSYQKNCCTVVANLAIHSEINLESTTDDLWQTLQTIRSTHYQLLNPNLNHRELLRKQDVADTHHFEQAVLAALNSIQNHVLNKVVLAHAIDIVSPLPFHLVHSIHNLRHLHPDCYLFAISNGKGQHFMGASPERLISLRNRQLLTDALAGSAPRGKTTCEDAFLANNLLNSNKEMHEHQVVLEFITRQLCHLGLTPQPSPLRLLQLSNIQHLQTPIQARVPAGIHLLDAIAELHPTPAVAGVPRDIACEHIRQYEAFERSLYAAPIGWVDHQGNGEFAVGIRSALIDGCHARLYAGAGIVAGSAPERELAEVQLKLQALLAALV
ncbi:isochorismate synthase [Leptothermofonsia sichuanensis E412]|uniref:isochorismate synthase n=1 Tax=Leptothermofonsia sichuanensis TaxID=2917832 RepID=UPI001CA729A0|nr:isochorismate synthase [Leptothermofonsia sichuanensis]QZZ20699.1 isochorismate synthase [Leptothermofonsia sichuanensis E412]